MQDERITVSIHPYDIEVDAHTGAVLTPVEAMPPHFANLRKVDVGEYRTWCSTNGITPSQHVDVLCLSLEFFENGKSREEPAEDDFRAILLAQLAEQTSPAAVPVLVDWTPRSMDSAVSDGKPILALCRHAADPYVDEASGKLTAYGCYCEHLGHVPDGWHVIEWVQGREESEGVLEPPSFWPGWWFLSGSQGEMPANPVAWLPIPLDYDPESVERKELSGVV